MENTLTLFLFLAAPLVVSATSLAQVPEIGDTSARPIPEVKKLFEAFAGDWDTTEKRERTQFFLNGGERKGRTHVRLAAGGAMLVMEGHSDGSAGPLSYIIVVWWDKDSKLCGYFTRTQTAVARCAALRIGTATSS